MPHPTTGVCYIPRSPWYQMNLAMENSLSGILSMVHSKIKAVDSAPIDLTIFLDENIQFLEGSLRAILTYQTEQGTHMPCGRLPQLKKGQEWLHEE